MTDGVVQTRVPALTLQGLPTRRLTVPAHRSSRHLAGAELLDRYSVERVLGEGGMATVYAGRHSTIGRPVAIKVLHDELAAQSEPVSWFLLEARAASRILHENVVEITDFGATPEDHVFLVMELLEGENLARTIAREGALPWSRAAAIVLQICAGLQAAHAAGVVHRDLKPANVFRITRGGTDDFVKVLDFGIAMIMAKGGTDGPLQRTDLRVIAGTPEYMAPEQARGEACDHRVDVYAAGAILYELATGCPPYSAASGAELMAYHLHAEVPDPCAVVDGLPTEVTDIVARAMAKRPADRFADMDELADAIRAATGASRPRRRGHAWTAAATAAISGASLWVVCEHVTGATQPPAAVAEPLRIDPPAPLRSPVLAPVAKPPVVAREPAASDAIAPREPERGSKNVPIVSAVPPPPPLATEPVRPRRKGKRSGSPRPRPRPAATHEPLDPSRPRTTFSSPATGAVSTTSPATNTEVKNPFAD